jgi:hypothetical protein
MLIFTLCLSLLHAYLYYMLIFTTCLSLLYTYLYYILTTMNGPSSGDSSIGQYFLHPWYFRCIHNVQNGSVWPTWASLLWLLFLFKSLSVSASAIRADLKHELWNSKKENTPSKPKKKHQNPHKTRNPEPTKKPKTFNNKTLKKLTTQTFNNVILHQQWLSTALSYKCVTLCTALSVTNVSRCALP